MMRSSLAPNLAVLAFCLSTSVYAANFISFDPPGANSTWPASINSSGAITGSYGVGKLDAHGFVREADGTITVFDPPRATQTDPVGFDGDGNVVGTISERISKGRGFIRSPDGKYRSTVPA